MTAVRASAGFHVGVASVRVVPSFEGFRESVQQNVGSSLESTAAGAEQSGHTAGERYQGGMRESLKGLAEVVGAAFAVEKVTEFFKESLSAGAESIKANQLLEAHLKSTGDASKLTAEQLGELAEKQAAGTATTKTYQEGLENMLLTFTNIHGEVYQKALPAVNDIAAAMHESGQSAAVQLGKALNDPIKGMSALQRVGITFSATQKKQITDWQTHGQTAKAQGAIIAEVEKEMGGSAAAAVTPAEKFHAAIENLQESIGEKLYPAVGKLADAASKYLLPAIQAFMNGALGSSNQEKLKGFAGTLQTIGTSVRTTVVSAFNTAKTAISGFIAGFQGKNATGGLATGFQQFGQVIKPIVTFLISHKAELADVAKAILAVWAAVKLADTVNASVQKVKDIGTAFRALGTNIRGAASGVATTFRGIGTGVSAGAAGINSGLQTVYLKFLYLKGGVASAATATAQWVKQTAINGAAAAKSFAIQLASTVKQLAQQAAATVVATARIVAQKVAQLAVAAATKTWAAAQLVLNAVMDANPIALIIIGITALVAVIVLVATKTTFFQTAWRDTWNFVKQLASDVWGFLTGKFGYLVAIIGPVGWIIAIGTHWSQVWGAIKAVASSVWGFLQTAFHYTVNFLANVLTGALRIISSAWSSSWNAIKKVASDIWGWLQGGLHSTVNYISGLWNKELQGWSNIWHSTWNGISNVATTIWHGIQGGLNTFSSGVQSTFKGIVNGVGKLWDGMKKTLAAPINWAITNVYDNGIARIWNDTAGKVGLGTLPKVNPIKLQRGGVVPGGKGGGDRVPAMLEPGERVLSNPQVDMLGGHGNIDKLVGGSRTKTRSGVQYAIGGGIIGGLGNIAKDVGGAIVGGAKAVGGAVSGAADWGLSKLHQLADTVIYDAAKPILNTFKSFVDGAVPKSPEWSHLPAAAVDKLVPAILSKFQAAQASAVASEGSVNGSADPGKILQYAVSISKGKPYVLGGVGPDSYDCSGLVQTAYRHFGVNVPRTSEAQWAAVTRESAAEAVPGDLVFENFPGEQSPGHVGIYAGPGTIWNAASPSVGIKYSQIQNLIGYGRFTRKAGLVGSNTTGGSNASTLAAGLKLAGQPAAWLGTMEELEAKESGGNAKAVNSTAVHGEHAEGLFQMLPSTFAANMVKGHGDIFNGLDNTAASARYIAGTYGNPADIPGLSDGGVYKGYAKGGLAQFGERAWVGENGPEIMEVTSKGTRIIDAATSALMAGKPTSGYAGGTDLQLGGGLIIPYSDINSLSNLNTDIATIRSSPSSAPAGELAALLAYKAQHFGGSTVAAKSSSTSVSSARAAGVNVNAIHGLRSGSTYSVGSGDTLSAIAAHYGTTVSKLAAANGIKNVNSISIGEKLNLGSATPKSGGAATLYKSTVSKTINAELKAVTAQVVSDTKTVSKLTGEQNAARLQALYGSTASARALGALEQKSYAVKLTAAKKALTSATASEKTLTADYNTVNAASIAAAAAAAKVSAATKAAITAQLNAVNAKLATADAGGANFASQAASGSNAGLGSDATLYGGGLTGSTATLKALATNVSKLSSKGLNPSIIQQILGLDPASALAYSNQLLSGSVNFKTLNSQYTGYQSELTAFGASTENSVYGSNALTAQAAALAKKAKKYAVGGAITEPVFGVGASGQSYTFGERESEVVIPSSSPLLKASSLAGGSGGGARMQPLVVKIGDETILDKVYAVHEEMAGVTKQASLAGIGNGG